MIVTVERRRGKCHRRLRTDEAAYDITDKIRISGCKRLKDIVKKVGCPEKIFLNPSRNFCWCRRGQQDRKMDTPLHI